MNKFGIQSTDPFVRTEPRIQLFILSFAAIINLLLLSFHVFGDYLLRFFFPNTFGYKQAPRATSLQAMAGSCFWHGGLLLSPHVVSKRRNPETKQDSYGMVNHQPPTTNHKHQPVMTRSVGSSTPWNAEAVRYTESSSLGWEAGERWDGRKNSICRLHLMRHS